MPIWVDGGEWNQEMAVSGRDLWGASGDGDLPWGRDLLTRLLTASETPESSSSVEDSEPDSESSKAGSRSEETDGKSNGNLYLQSGERRQIR
jgi:hypothetical protein